MEDKMAAYGRARNYGWNEHVNRSDHQYRGERKMSSEMCHLTTVGGLLEKFSVSFCRSLWNSIHLKKTSQEYDGFALKLTQVFDLRSTCVLLGHPLVLTLVELKLVGKSRQIDRKSSCVKCTTFCDLRELASRLANPPFGHPSQVRTQVLVLRVRLARALDIQCTLWKRRWCGPRQKHSWTCFLWCTGSIHCDRFEPLNPLRNSWCETHISHFDSSGTCGNEILGIWAKLTDSDSHRQRA